MTFALFVTWVLVGVSVGLVAGLVMKPGGHGLKRDVMLGLAGSVGLSLLLRTVGLFSGAGIAAATVIAVVGAGLPIVAQRKFWPTQSTGEEPTGIRMWRWGLGAAVVAVVLWMTLGPAPQPAATAAVLEDKAYPVTPAAMKVKAGILTGEVTEMKVTERVEQGSGRAVSSPKFTARMTLKNTSTDQTIRLVAGKIRYIDARGATIELAPSQTEPALRFATGGNDRLDPGQEVTESVDVDFPIEALKATTLKEIRFDLAYIPSSFRQESAHVPVSIGGR